MHNLRIRGEGLSGGGVRTFSCSLPLPLFCSAVRGTTVADKPRLRSGMDFSTSGRSTEEMKEMFRMRQLGEGSGNDSEEGRDD